MYGCMYVQYNTTPRIMLRNITIFSAVPILVASVRPPIGLVNILNSTWNTCFFMPQWPKKSALLLRVITFRHAVLPSHFQRYVCSNDNHNDDKKFTIHDLRSTLSFRLRGYRIGNNESYVPYHYALKTYFWRKSIRSKKRKQLFRWIRSQWILARNPSGPNPEQKKRKRLFIWIRFWWIPHENRSGPNPSTENK